MAKGHIACVVRYVYVLNLTRARFWGALLPQRSENAFIELAVFAFKSEHTARHGGFSYVLIIGIAVYNPILRMVELKLFFAFLRRKFLHPAKYRTSFYCIDLRN